MFFGSRILTIKLPKIPSEHWSATTRHQCWCKHFISANFTKKGPTTETSRIQLLYPFNQHFLKKKHIISFRSLNVHQDFSCTTLFGLRLHPPQKKKQKKTSPNHKKNKTCRKCFKRPGNPICSIHPPGPMKLQKSGHLTLVGWGDLLGIKIYPVTWGLKEDIIRIPIEQPIYWEIRDFLSWLVWGEQVFFWVWGLGWNNLPVG